MLIVAAEIYGLGVADLRVDNGKIAAIGQLATRPGEAVLDLRGGAALPGLNDHHIHLMAYAASLDAERCGPPEVHDARQLIAALASAKPNESGWIRGIGYHESVAGDIDRCWLDRHLPPVPVRVQHRSGRLWILNGAGLRRLVQELSRRVGESAEQGELRGYGGAATRGAYKSLPAHRDGRFYDRDRELARLWGRTPVSVARASRRLAAYGVTGITDLTPSNDDSTAAHIDELQTTGQLLQHIRVGGGLEMTHRLIGPTKVHLHESSLPDFDDFCESIGGSHARGREVAVHCVTEVELVFTLAAFRAAGVMVGDRIEHASVAPPALLSQIRELGLVVVTQPHFIAERGDAYLREIRTEQQAWLYRGRSFLNSRIPLAAGSDAPFGHPDPWRAMRAAVDRKTATGRFLGEMESLTPEQALALFLGTLRTPAKPRPPEVGASADLCLLDRPWRAARKRLDSTDVRATLCAGEIIYAKCPASRPENTGACL